MPLPRMIAKLVPGVLLCRITTAADSRQAVPDEELAAGRARVQLLRRILPESDVTPLSLMSSLHVTIIPLESMLTVLPRLTLAALAQYCVHV